MIQHISWATYFLLMFQLVIVYYIIILTLYYRTEIQGFIKEGLKKGVFLRRAGKQLIEQDNSEVMEEQSTGTNMIEDQPQGLSHNYDLLDSIQHDHQYGEPDSSRLFTFVHELMHEIGQVLKTATRKNYIKEELITALQMKISHYPMLENTTFKVSINNFVATESRKSCSIFLSVDELERLWKKGN